MKKKFEISLLQPLQYCVAAEIEIRIPAAATKKRSTPAHTRLSHRSASLHQPVKQANIKKPAQASKKQNIKHLCLFAFHFKRIEVIYRFITQRFNNGESLSY
jgi:hypothetical protein